MPRCIAENCKSASTKGVKMCSFPQEKEIQSLWIKNIGRNNWQPRKDSRLCEFHFADDQWEKIRVDGTKKLKWKAVPTLFGEAAQTRKDAVKNKHNQQELPNQKESLLTNKNEILEQLIDRDTIKISERAQDDNIKEMSENIQGETESDYTEHLVLIHSKTIFEYERKLENLEKRLLQSERSRKVLMKRLWYMRTKFKKLQQETRTNRCVKNFNSTEFTLRSASHVRRPTSDVPFFSIKIIKPTQ